MGNQWDVVWKYGFYCLVNTQGTYVSGYEPNFSSTLHTDTFYGITSQTQYYLLLNCSNYDDSYKVGEN